MRTGVSLLFGVILSGAAAAGEALPVSLDREGGYAILASEATAKEYAAAIEGARKLHPGAVELALDPSDPEKVLDGLRKAMPGYALVFARPAELDVNLAWRWLGLSTRIDDDPFVDVRTGFVTGATPGAAAALVSRIAGAAAGSLELPASFVDDLGLNTGAPPDAFWKYPLSSFLLCLNGKMPVFQISHGKEGFTDARLGSLAGCGLVHFGAHGYPDRIVDGVSGRQAAKLALSPSVVFNGACYTGVTSRWFEQWTREGKVRERRVAPAESFCLNLLGNEVVAYLAALHPDHGIPVYQEMEHLAATGAPLGEVMRRTMNGVILAAGGKLPALAPFADGQDSPRWTPGDVMLKGTASRVLFGDPALRVLEPLQEPALKVTAEARDGALLLTATPRNLALRFTLTDTYHSDLSQVENLFNDRALVTAELPEGFAPKRVEIVRATAGGKDLRHRLVGWGVEEDEGVRRVHVQVDLETTGYAAGPWRSLDAKLVIRVEGI